MKELLENAVLSIELGVEDFEANDERRLLSAIRNLYAGVLLLCKQVLWNESPPSSDGALIYKHLVPEKQSDGTVLMRPKKAHRNTVDRRLIEERFKSLDLDLDWDRLTKLANIRNDAEHLFLKATPTVAREVLASAMPLIERLLVEHLEEDPLAVFDNAVWQKLLTNQEVFEAQQARCVETFENIVWASDLAAEAVEDLRCDQCGSTLIRQADPDNTKVERISLECAECTASPDFEDAFEAALSESTSGHAYIAMTDGGEMPTTTCPECGRETWITEDARCVFCGELDLTCGICGTACHPDDYNGDDGLCSSCSWTMQKAMRDD